MAKLFDKSGKSGRFVGARHVSKVGFKQIEELCEKPPKASKNLIRLMALAKKGNYNSAA